MMTKHFVRVIILLLISFNASSYTVSPESPTRVQLSNKDVNRVKCQSGPINDVYFSQEKGISVSVNDQNAFIKFLIKEDGNENSFVNAESEFYVVCDGEIYTILTTPEDIPAQTIYLSNPVKKTIEKNISIYTPMSIEEQAVDLIKRAIKDDLLDTFSIVNYSHDKQISQIDERTGLILNKTREIQIEGIGLKLSEYIANSNKHIQLSEMDFLKTCYGTNIIAITVDPLNLVPGDEARVYVVERVI